MSMQEDIASGAGLRRIHYQKAPQPDSASGTVIATGGTIPADPPVQCFKPAGDVTGLIMAKADRACQVTIINESASSMTFAAVATSNVANGVSCVVSTLAAVRLTYNPSDSRWYQDRAV